MKSIRNNTPPPTKRRLKTKPTLMLISILLLGNLLWFIAWLIPNNDVQDSEEVATVGGKAITKEQWVAEMESRYGKEVLLDMVNTEVMEAAAKRNNIKVTEEEVDLELALTVSSQEGNDTSLQAFDKETIRKKIRSRLILEKVLTKDLGVEKKSIEDFYENNQNLFDIPTSYRASIIYVSSEEEAKKVVKQLNNKSSFEGLARELSIDPSSASLGGDIGYITVETPNLDSAIAQAVSKIDEGKWSDAISLEDGRYAVVLVEDIIKGQSFSFKEVEEHIKRDLALNQISQSVPPQSFWQEFDANWLYGEE